jgi:hypothetical protein
MGRDYVCTFIKQMIENATKYVLLNSLSMQAIKVCHCRLQIGCCDGVRLPFQHCGLGPIVLFPDNSDADQ